MEEYGVLLLLVCSLFIFVSFLVSYVSKLLEDIKEQVLMRKSLGLVFYELQVPKTNNVEIRAVEQMYSGLINIQGKLEGIQSYFGARTFVSFEIVAFKESIRFYVVCPKKISSVVDRLINGIYPSVEIVKTNEYNIFPDDAYVSFTNLELKKDSRVPFQTYEELPVDFLATLSDSFSKLKSGESVVFQVVITPVGSDWNKNVRDFIKKQREIESEQASSEKAEKDNASKTKKKKEFTDEELNLMNRKVEKPCFYTDVRLVVVSAIKESAEEHVQNIMSTLDQLSKENGNSFKKGKSKKPHIDYVYRIPRCTMVLNTSELATLFHLPNEKITTPHIKWLLSKRAPAPDFVCSEFREDYMYVGKNTFRGNEKEIFIKPEDRLRHFYVIGQTGTGKSGFMGGMMIRDIKMGHGCGFIDPHGSDADKILAQVPPERIEDVIVFDPSDLSRPIGLNMLEFKTEAQKTLVTDEMLNIFDTLYDLKATGGPIFEQYFRYGIMLLTEDAESGATLLEIPKIFADEGYRNYKLSKCTNQEVIDFWRKQAEAATGDISLKNVVPYVVSKLGRFLTNVYLRPIIAQQKSTLNFREIMDNKKILIAKLSKGRIGELNANLLGMILIGKLLVGALERDEIPEKDRVPFYLYIDEFQNFLTDGIQIILSEARKYKLSLTLAHQFLGQLVRKGGDTKIRDAIFGNVGNKIIMRIGEEDAGFLKNVVGEPFDEADLQQLPNFTGVIKLLVDGKPTPSFTVRAFYGESPYDMYSFNPDPQVPTVAREISRLKYGRDRDLIETEIKYRGTFIKENVDKKEKGTDNFGLFTGF
ncbi:hypothetical protein D6810_01780 [Candidatus Dojkabacteria bacterium]|uniref:Uncharacterized protein n=1 Tax=Candidatus Dojkabacteria bacterium TaxID=2099670 RepID=A0A3M0YYT4_9BACT|nr:MAG: hypothetical protein D6810_01780 [Candidatus Dojkabacteria bacterium]